MDNNERKVLLSLKNVEVKFNVRGRILTAIRNVSLDIYEHEALAIVGESGSGKSVLTKTFAGMLDSNGFIPQGSIIFADDEISHTDVKLTPANKRKLDWAVNMLNKLSPLERGAAEYRQITELKNQITHAKALSLDEEADFTTRLKALSDDVVDSTNYLWTLDKRADAAEYAQVEKKIKDLNAQKAALEKEKVDLAKKRESDYKSHPERAAADQKKLKDLEELRQKKIATPDKEGNPFGLSDSVLERNKIIGYEILLSIGRYPMKDQIRFLIQLRKAFKQAMMQGEDLNDPEVRNAIFETVSFRVEYRSFVEENQIIRGYAIID